MATSLEDEAHLPLRSVLENPRQGVLGCGRHLALLTLPSDEPHQDPPLTGGDPGDPGSLGGLPRDREARRGAPSVSGRPRPRPPRVTGSARLTDGLLRLSAHSEFAWGCKGVIVMVSKSPFREIKRIYLNGA